MTVREKLDRRLVNALTSLYVDHSWLAKRSAEVIELIDSCESREEQELLIELLNLFEFINPETYQECLDSICKQITSVWNLKEDDTMLVSPSADEEADSGQLILYDVRSALAKNNGWRHTTTVNRFRKCVLHKRRSIN
jgi:hypothetical protein